MATLYRNVDDSYFRPFGEDTLGYLTHDSHSYQVNIFDLQAKLVGETDPIKIEKYARDITNLARTTQRANKHEGYISNVCRMIIMNVPENGVVNKTDLEIYIHDNFPEFCEKKTSNNYTRICRPKGLVAVVLNRLTANGYLERKMNRYGDTVYMRTSLT